MRLINKARNLLTGRDAGRMGTDSKVNHSESVCSFDHASLRRGLAGNQPLRTRSRCSRTSMIDQKDEKAVTPQRMDARPEE